jgi:hypothetical protein
VIEFIKDGKPVLIMDDEGELHGEFYEELKKKKRIEDKRKVRKTKEQEDATREGNEVSPE